MTSVHIIGGGLAGCEAAWQLAKRGVKVCLSEMRPLRKTAVHTGEGLAQLVCSNSLKSKNPDSAAGLLKQELRSMGSLLIEKADECAVPAGGALAVDRDMFSESVTRELESCSLITIERKEIKVLDDEGFLICAAGPLVSDELAEAISRIVGRESMAFYDAAAPIVDAQSLDTSVIFSQSRYEKGDGADYLNAPMNREEYEAFINELVNAKRVISKDFERRELFTACQPIEEVARTGLDAPRFGALKPVGLEDPRTGKRPWAVVQLRAENKGLTAYNLVGFQTNLTFPEQNRIFRMIPGLKNAEFLRHGVMHRNTFIDAPRLLDSSLQLRGRKGLRFAGQITGTEGYCEAIASGLYAAICTYADIKGKPYPVLPRNSAFGSLVAYATDPLTQDYQPMHVNFGLLESLEGVKPRGKKERYTAYAQRAQKDMERFLNENRVDFQW